MWRTYRLNSFPFTLIIFQRKCCNLNKLSGQSLDWSLNMIILWTIIYHFIQVILCTIYLIYFNNLTRYLELQCNDLYVIWTKVESWLIYKNTFISIQKKKKKLWTISSGLSFVMPYRTKNKEWVSLFSSVHHEFHIST